jgi:putative ABC transport system permease protein
MFDFIAGLRHAVRSLRRTPAFALLAITILATGIGSTAVMYTLVRAVLLRELPFRDPDRLVWMYNLRTERDRAPLSLPDLDDYRREGTTLAGLAAFTNWTTNITGAGDPERLDGVRVSGEFFPLIGTEALLGRLLQPEDQNRDARLTVITHGLWQRRFAADPGIVGKSVSLNGTVYTIVGVLPPRFLFPFRDAELAVPLPVRSDARRSDRGANFVRVIARLNSGVSLAEATANLDAIAHRLRRLYPDDDARKTGISLYPLHNEIVRDYRSMLWTLLVAVGVLLLVGCVNLANLLLVRAAGRSTEFAVRRSLGASRARLARQLLGETAMVTTLGGTLGLVLAYAGLSGWRAGGPSDFPQMSEVAIDSHVLAFAAMISVATAFACGLAPAWLASRNGILRGDHSNRTSTTNRRQRTLQRGFVTAQIAAATILLVGMLLMTKGLARLEQVSPGFHGDQALSVQLSLPPGRYANREALSQFFDALHDRLRADPAVESAGAVSLLPLSGLLSTADVAFPDRPAPPPDEVPQAHLRITTPEYFNAIGVQILDGRSFDDHDNGLGRPVAIVSQTFASRHWPGNRAVGRRLQIVQASASPELEVVGVANDVKQFALDGPATADLYVPLRQMPAFQAPLMATRMFVIVRSREGTVNMSKAIRAAVTRIDPGVAASASRTLESIWIASLGSRRANVRLLQVFGDVALALCAIGVYGVTAFTARTRRRELAIRTALGATRRDLTIVMLRGEMRPVLVGLAAGLAGAGLLAPLLFAAAFAISPYDAATYVEVSMLLFTVAIVATYVPVRRAGAADPTEALHG